MKQVFKFMVSAVVCAMFLVSCGGAGKGYVGTWEAKAFGTTITLVLNEDGTGSTSAGGRTENFDFEVTDQGKKVKQIAFGYKDDEGNFKPQGNAAFYHGGDTLEVSGFKYVKVQDQK